MAAQDEYNRIITEARDRILQRARNAPIDDMRERVAEALVQVQREAAGELRPDQLRARFNEQFQRLQTQLTQQIREQKARAQTETENAHEEALAAALAALGIGALAFSPRVEQPEDTVDEQVRTALQSAADTVDEVIEAAANEGADVSPDVRDIVSDLTSTTASDVAEAAARAIAGEQLQDALRDAGMNIDAEGGKLENNLRRSIAHEVARSADETGKQIAAQSPLVDLVQWTLSPNHTADKSYTPDACDVLAQADPHGYGEGLYHPAVVPVLPHPWCECRLEVVLHDPDDIGTDREIPDQPTIEENDLRSIMEGIEGDRTVTDAYVTNQRSQLHRAFAQAYDNPRGTTTPPSTR